MHTLQNQINLGSSDKSLCFSFFPHSQATSMAARKIKVNNAIAREKSIFIIFSQDPILRVVQ